VYTRILMMNKKELIDLSAVQLLAHYRSGRTSPSEYAQALAMHIACWEQHIHALYLYDEQRLLDAAAASTLRHRRGEPKGLLDGVPVTLKELIATEGDPIPQGSAANPLLPAPRDAPAAARMRESGAILLAKTTVPDFGMLSSGLSSFHPLTRNPWNLAMNPGGSSAGLGRIPVDPYYTGRCAGPMARHLEDIALAMQVLSQPDWRDATSLPPEKIDWTLRTLLLDGLRIGVQLAPGCGLEPGDEVCNAVLLAAREFERHGATLVPVAPILTREMLDGIDKFWRAREWAEFMALPPERRELILPYIRDWGNSGAQVDGAEAVLGFNQTFALRRAAAELFQSVDALLAPTNQIAQYPADWASPTNDPMRPFEHIAFTLPWNMGEQPALSLNCGFTSSGMPIGMQIVGPRFADKFVLDLAWTRQSWGQQDIDWPRLPVVSG
jgi:amidase